MIGMPLAGWLTTQASPPHSVLPAFNAMTPLQLKAEHDFWRHVHTAYIAVLGYVLIALHVGGALKHRLLDGDDYPARMMPRLRRPRRSNEIADLGAGPGPGDDQ
jgi:cytochrome b561